jgi:hypothetical protein
MANPIIICRKEVSESGVSFRIIINGTEEYICNKLKDVNSSDNGGLFPSDIPDEMLITIRKKTFLNQSDARRSLILFIVKTSVGVSLSLCLLSATFFLFENALLLNTPPLPSVAVSGALPSCPVLGGSSYLTNEKRASIERAASKIEETKVNIDKAQKDIDAVTAEVKERTQTTFSPTVAVPSEKSSISTPTIDLTWD